MRYFLGAAALFAATVSADLCSEGSSDDNGNWYCQLVSAITYTGVGGSGSYNKVTSMDSTSGTCSSTPQSYSGNVAPLDEEVSLHFRGPLNLKQFAVYTPSAASTKARRSAHERRHAHGHGHQHLHHAREAEPVAEPIEERAVGDMVIATINGVVESWVNEYTGQATSAVASAATATAQTTAAIAVNKVAPSSSAKSASATATSSSSSASSSGSWGRQAYYDSESQQADGVVFLNHEGGSGSGVFDYTFGNSLSYASTDGASGSSSPQLLADTTLASSTEVVIMSDQECSNNDCGYVRDGTVAYHGFDGASKAFFFEFGMPSDGQTGASQYDAVNMPAIWMLNAQIPRTLQYGNEACSCWETGCGEFDIFEVLAAGDSRCKSTLHGNIAGGDSDYFARPFTGTIKAALVLYDDNIHIKVLDNSTDFGSSMSTSVINDIVDGTLTQALGVSLFQLAGALSG